MKIMINLKCYRIVAVRFRSFSFYFPLFSLHRWPYFHSPVTTIPTQQHRSVCMKLYGNCESLKRSSCSQQNKKKKCITLKFVNKKNSFHSLSWNFVAKTCFEKYTKKKQSSHLFGILNIKRKTLVLWRQIIKTINLNWSEMKDCFIIYLENRLDYRSFHLLRLKVTFGKHKTTQIVWSTFILLR